MPGSTDEISVLHVDDEPDFAEMVAGFLERESEVIQVEPATGVEEAHERLNRREFDCIVSDYDMPGRNGIEFLEAVRGDYPEVPFILYTGKGSEEVASDAISAGVTDYLQKTGGSEQYEILVNRIRNAVERHRAHRAIEESERQLREVYERITDGFFAVNSDWEYVYINEEGARLTDRTVEELVGQTVWEAFPGLVDSPFEEALRRAMEAETTTKVEDYYPPLDAWYDVRVYGSEEGISIYFQDVTQRKRRERELTRLEEEYEIVFENARDSLFLAEVSESNGETEFELRQINPANADAFGISPEEARGRSPVELFGEDVGQQIRSNYLRCLEAGETISFEEQLPLNDETRTFETSVTPVEIDGHVERIVGVAHDITDRKEHEQELEAIHERMTHALDVTDSLIFENDLQNEIVTRHGPFERLFGCESDEITSTDEFYANCVHPEDRGRLREARSDLLSNGDNRISVEFRTHPEHGDLRWINLEGYLRTGPDGTPQRIIGLDTDITERKERERELQSQRNELQVYQRAVEGASDLLAAMDGDYNYLFANERYRDYHGLTGDVTGQSVPAVLEGQWESEVKPQVDRVLDGEEVRYEMERRDADGTARRFEIQYVPLRNEHGSIEGVVGGMRDITDRQDRELERQRERDRRAALFENASNPVMEVTFDDEEPLITDVNPAFEATFGLAAEAVVHQPVAEVVVPDSKREEHEHLKDQVLQGEVVEAQVKRETAAGIRDFLLQIIPVERGDLSKGAYAWYIDITEREEWAGKITRLHKVATELEASETESAVYERLIEAAEEILNYDLAMVDAVQGDALVSAAVSTDVDPDEYYEHTPISASDNLAAETFRTGEPSVVDDLRTRGVSPAQSEYRAALTVPIGDHGVFQIVSAEAGAFDETDRELAELLCDHARATLANIEHRQELQRQNERLEEFASVVSHDLRNPLRVAEGGLELAADECQSEHLETVAQAHRRMEALIEDLLSLAKAGETLGDLGPVGLRPLIDACWSQVEMADANLAIETDATIRADESQLRQLFENLFRNAKEHAGPQVSVTVGASSDGFYVADNGPGIPTDKRQAVLEPGYSTAEDGTGFGLSIIRDIAEAHGWRIDISASDSGGARFEFNGVEFTD